MLRLSWVRIGVSASGYRYLTIGIPGTGLYFMKYFGRPRSAFQRPSQPPTGKSQVTAATSSGHPTKLGRSEHAARQPTTVVEAEEPCIKKLIASTDGRTKVLLDPFAELRLNMQGHGQVGPLVSGASSLIPVICAAAIKRPVAKVTTALARMANGNMSNVKGIGSGLFECRIDFGPGYRVYFGKDGERFVILLGGGTKKRQQRDIEDASECWTVLPECRVQ
jgi:putative addiction module killer protein